MMKRILWIGVLLMTAVATARAADVAATKGASATQGAFKPVACELDLIPFISAVAAGGIAEGSAAKDSAVLTARALVGQAAAGDQKVKFSIALDFSSPEAKEADLLYVDFLGEGKFSKDNAVKLTKGAPPSKAIEYMGEFGGTVQAQRGDMTYPIVVQGVVMRMGKAHQVVLCFARAVEGGCDFGGKSHLVRLVDGTGNSRFDDAGKVDPKSMGNGLADVVLVDVGDGTFKSCLKAWYGQPILVDGKWYTLTASADGSTVSAQPTEIKSGLLGITPGNCELTLVSDSKPYLVTASGPMPAGQYKVMYLKEFTQSDPQGKRGWLLAGFVDFITKPDEAKLVTVQEGKTAELALGSPLSAELTVKVTGQDVAFSLAAPKTQAGLSVAMMAPPGAAMPFRQIEPPKVQILDQAGKLVETISMEFG